MKKSLLSLLAALAFLPLVAGAATISGNVTTGGTTPVVGAKVVLIAAGVHVDSVMTDSVGHYTFDSTHVGATGAKQVQASKAGMGTVTNTVNITCATQAATSNFNLAAGGNLAGTVRKTSDSTVLAGAKVVLRRGNTSVDSAITNGSGQFTFNDQAPATNYSLVTSAATYFTTTTTVSITANASLSVTLYLALTVPATITGTVTNSSGGAPISGALVRLRRGSATSAVVDSVTTNGSGVYSFSGVAPGTPNAWVTASANGFFSITNNNLTVGNGATVTSNFSLVMPGRITGTAQGYPAPGILVNLANALIVLRRGSDTAAISDSTRTNSSGVYTFNNLTPGTPNYWVTINSNIGTATNANVAVTAGGTTTSNFSISATAIARLSKETGALSFSKVGNELYVKMSVSSSERTVTVFGMSGGIAYHTSVPVGASQISVPAVYAPENGYLFQVK